MLFIALVFSVNSTQTAIKCKQTAEKTNLFDFLSIWVWSLIPILISKIGNFQLPPKSDNIFIQLVLVILQIHQLNREQSVRLSQLVYFC